ncbi:MAG TPA: hypothetical protein VET66_14315, partial [Steroidobacteraceae bacterium]|nr:hypothetical protein [Steroidobacteraceae bacterium]
MEHANPQMIQAAIYFAAAVVAVLVARRLGLGSVAGYLLAGIAIGPYGFRLVDNAADMHHLAERLARHALRQPHFLHAQAAVGAQHLVEEADDRRAQHARGHAQAAGEVRGNDRVGAHALELLDVAHLVAARHHAHRGAELLRRQGDEQVLRVVIGDREHAGGAR